MMPTFTNYPTQGYRVRVSTYWWLGRRAYLKFILREISSVFVAWFVLVTIIQIRGLAHGPAAYARVQHYLENPLVIGLNLISFFFVVFHAITWFNLAPKAMAIRMGGKRVPGIMISGPNYIAWIVVSAAVAWLLLRG
jgi:fumarate reductase subunit C